MGETTCLPQTLPPQHHPSYLHRTCLRRLQKMTPSRPRLRQRMIYRTKRLTHLLHSRLWNDWTPLPPKDPKDPRQTSPASRRASRPRRRRKRRRSGKRLRKMVIPRRSIRRLIRRVPRRVPRRSPAIEEVSSLSCWFLDFVLKIAI